MFRPFILTIVALIGIGSGQRPTAAQSLLEWQELPALPNELGVAGAFAGISRDALIVAGGANFPRPVWETDKQWTKTIHVLTRTDNHYAWHDGGELPRPIAYGASVTTPHGVLCMGGCDAERTYADVFLLRWMDGGIECVECAPLPHPVAYAQAVVVGSKVYLACGQTGLDLASATNEMWVLEMMPNVPPTEWKWSELAPLPGLARAFNLVAAQHDGFYDGIYVIGGRSEVGNETKFLADTWEYRPTTGDWVERRHAPRAMMAGEAIGMGQSHLLILGAADDSHWEKAEELKDWHPGFPKEAWAYHTITDTWTPAGETPENLVTTSAVRWDNAVVIPTGEVRPRVRSSKVWQVTLVATSSGFGWINYGVLFSYLLSMVGIGVYFTRRNKNTDDYFRGGKQIPWWAAGCSIFATMLSSLTFTGLPSKAFAQDWVYAIGNLTIPFVAILAVYVALPFYRRIDATSAYEYLQMRFGRSVRLFASMSFVLFHLFRMAVVMSLTALALAVATPLSPSQSVLLMGVLSIAYCTLGGIEAVIWTDTIQTFVLLGGAVLAVGLLLLGVDGGMSGFWEVTQQSQKFNYANWHHDITSAQVALWVIIAGAAGQNVASYTADQAVVQRYVTTPTEQLAARSIWLSALLTIPATILFFLIGTALFAFYSSHPEKLDPTITTDQIFPLFIAREIPVGLAGLIVAGVFAAAQSTVSTSMNSSATTIIVDFLRPLDLCTTEVGYLRAARACTLIIGTVGTMLGLMFVHPGIRSLFDAFIMILGLFMGILGGLFLLGALTRRANQWGAMVGAIAGTLSMLVIWRYTPMHGYFYPAASVSICFVMGYLASFLRGGQPRDLAGLTIYDSTPTPARNEKVTV
ncbi:sodium:solute symporter family transporter [Bremerella cremea]|uniref:sodium:solute symporter family transporter n=1 Tax=Bremerella cremea TaxID=1031537 RepID=UPI0031EC4809